MEDMKLFYGIMFGKDVEYKKPKCICYSICKWKGLVWLKISSFLPVRHPAWSSSWPTLLHMLIYKLLIIGPWYIFWLTVPLLNLLHPSIHVMFTWVLLIYLYNFYSYIWDTRCTAGYISLITMKQLPCFPCLFVKMSVFYKNEYGISTECFL